MPLLPQGVVRDNYRNTLGYILEPIVAYVSSFSGFAPEDKPSICLVVVLEGLDGTPVNRVVSQIAGTLTEEMLDYNKTS